MAEWTLVVPRADVARTPADRVFARPHPALAAHVLTYTAHDFARTDPVPWRVGALGVITMTIDLDPPARRCLDSGADVPGSPVLGLRDRPLLLQQGGASRGIVVAMTPLGAYALFGVPLRHLANAGVGLTDLLGAEADLLRERIAETDGWPARFRVLDRFLVSRIRRGPVLSLPVQGAWRRLTASAGRVRIDAVADEIGWTRQHLSARFGEQIGLRPKVVARVARLHHAASLMTAGACGSWADVAHRAGYADQSHLHRDFRRLTGCTPSEYAVPAR